MEGAIVASPPQERLESGLLEVLIGAQGIGESTLPHDLEGDAVNERPFFVGTAAVEGEAGVKAKAVGRKNEVAAVRAHLSDKRRGTRSCLDAGEKCEELGEDPLG